MKGFGQLVSRQEHVIGSLSYTHGTDRSRHGNVSDEREKFTPWEEEVSRFRVGGKP